MRAVGGLIGRLKKGEPGPGRHFNPYLEEALEFQDILYIQDEILPTFPYIFEEKTAPLLLEIGCYMGKNVLEFAHLNPGWNVLGIDITYKRVVKSARKIKREKISNARIGICDGFALIDASPSDVLAGTCVFFPDPWMKKKQRHNRLLNAIFLEKLFAKTKPGGFFWFKTDSLDYFQEVMELLANGGLWKEDALAACGAPADLAEGSYTTAFEKLFTEQGLPLYRCLFRKPLP
jgi:tRNA (guanine-N7-)-methyltransferase